MLPSDLPNDLPSFVARFGSDDACRDYLFARRWPDGFCCTRCSGRRCYRLAKRLVYECSACSLQQALLAGTVFEQTKSPLRIWFLACHLFVSSKGGISALELKRHLGFKSDQTAWTWLHKLRAAMSVRGGPLEGSVEVDETLIGGPEPGKRGRGAAGKTLVVAAVEVRTAAVVAPDPAPLSGAARTRAVAMAARLKGADDEVARRCLGRIRLAIIGAASTADLSRFIAAAIAPGAAVSTDGWAAYRKAVNPQADSGRDHTRIVVSKAGPAHEYLPAVHLVFTLVKRLINGTYHGGIGRHLARYLDEFTFRFNRKSLPPTERVMTVIDRALATQPLTIRMIFARS